MSGLFWLSLYTHSMTQSAAASSVEKFTWFFHNKFQIRISVRAECVSLIYFTLKTSTYSQVFIYATHYRELRQTHTLFCYSKRKDSGVNFSPFCMRLGVCVLLIVSSKQNILCAISLWFRRQENICNSFSCARQNMQLHCIHFLRTKFNERLHQCSLDRCVLCIK